MRRHVVKIAPTGFFADYGCHVRILEEARALQEHGYDVTVVTYPGGRDPPGLRVVRIPAWLHRGAPRVGSHWRKLMLDPALLATALTRLPSRPVDIVHAHLHEGVLIGWPLARMHGAGLVFDYQGSLTREMLDHQFIRAANPLLHVFSWLERLANRLPDRILTSSENARNTLIAESGIPSNRVVAVTDGVNLARFRPRRPGDVSHLENVRRRLGIPPNRLLVGYLGLLAPYQGTDDLIRAAQLVVRRNPGAHFLVMGFPNEDAYRHAAHAAGLADHMHFTGRVPYADAPEMLRVLDIAVAPKRSESEGNGKVLNYMAAGLPWSPTTAPSPANSSAQPASASPSAPSMASPRASSNTSPTPTSAPAMPTPSATASNASTAGTARSNTSSAYTTPCKPGTDRRRPYTHVVEPLGRSRSSSTQPSLHNQSWQS